MAFQSCSQIDILIHWFEELKRVAGARGATG
jgi:hypothetical protein